MIFKSNKIIFFIYKDGTKYWHKDGKRHRKDGPAMIYPNGNSYWYNNGRYHRGGDEPAVIYYNGTKYWYRNGKCIKSH
jgi:hypothetical protein